MTLREVLDSVGGEVICGEDQLDRSVKLGFASDLMSEVLTLLDDDILLITGLSNIQSIRTAEKPTPHMIELAKEHHIVLMSTQFSMFKASYLLCDKGLCPVY